MKSYKYDIKMALLDLSDRSYQEMVWLNIENHRNWQSSFIEAQCMLFDDLGLGDDLDSNTTVFNNEIDYFLRKLSSLMSEAGKLGSDADIIQSEEMRIIRTLASDILVKIIIFEENQK